MVVSTRENTVPQEFAPPNAVGVEQRSSYLAYLPAIYSEGDFMGRFLMIFESVMAPLEEVLDNISYYLDPAIAPPELLTWLASWLNLVLDETWPLESRRALIKSAVELYQWRGTKRGLRDYLKVYSGVEPEITEEFGGLTLDGSARLGWNTILGGSGGQFTFNVRLELDDPASVNLRQLKSIIESEKPAHTAYSLEVVAKNGSVTAQPTQPPESTN